ncbi:MAG: AAA family ATPase [Gammaproteobacteria bacterium]|nr:AAA family ATPase [Gammaproteobacteria bacterium]
MRSRPYRLREVLIENFRCFREKRAVRLTPLTLLVGDNSTGKTSFLAALRLVWDIAYRKMEPDFRSDPYDLGPFSEVAYNASRRRPDTNSFSLGFNTITDADTPVKFSVTFKERAGAPVPGSLSWSGERTWVKHIVSDEGYAYTDFGITDRAWRFTNSSRRYESSSVDFLLPMVLWLGTASRGREVPFGRIEPLSGSPEFPTDDDLDAIWFEFELFPATSLIEERPYASAPTRSSPRRTYDRSEMSAEGTRQTAIYLADQFYDREQWNTLKQKLEEFGRTSGLFDEISIKLLGKSVGDPFQLQVRKYSKSHRRGPKRNLIDVGYGVSQALDLATELLRPEGPYTFLLQQPEVHLHPSAQAALGSLFCEMVASGRQLIVETHSEYIIDRVRMDLRDGRTDLRPEDVSILFFERSDGDIRIHSLRFDDQGNVLGAPDGYGQFFMDEVRRSVGL